MSLSDQKRRARPGRSKRSSPLECLRIKGNLTVSELAEKFGVSIPTVSRWLNGNRAAPRRFIKALQWAAAARDFPEVQGAQQKYVERQRRREKPPALEVCLPSGISVEEARKVALGAIRAAVARSRAHTRVEVVP